MTESNTSSNQPDAPVDGPDASEQERAPLGAARPADSDTSAEKDPAQWVTGDEAMTEAQRSYLDTLAREAGEQLDPQMSKAEASEHIDRLQSTTGRGEG